MKRMGRPPLPESEKAGVNLTIRMRPILYDSLRRSATENCRSISAEAEYRLKEALGVAYNREYGQETGLQVVS